MDSPFIFSFLHHPPLFLAYFSEVLRCCFFFSSQVGQIHWEMRKNKPKFLWEIFFFPPPRLTSLQMWSDPEVLLLLLYCVSGPNCFWTCASKPSSHGGCFWVCVVIFFVWGWDGCLCFVLLIFFFFLCCFSQQLLIIWVTLSFSALLYT